MSSNFLQNKKLFKPTKGFCMPYPCSLLTAHNNTKRNGFLCAVGRGNIVSKADVIAIIKCVIVLWVLLGQASSLMAAPQARSLVQFDIPRQSADDSLPAFGQQADVTVMYPFEDANKHITNRLYGEYTRKEGIHTSPKRLRVIRQVQRRRSSDHFK